MSRSSHAGNSAILPGQHSPDFLGGKFAQAGLHERADNSTAHPVEKAIAFDDEREQRAAQLKVATRQVANGRLALVTRAGGKGVEIVFADKKPSCSSDDAPFQTTRHVPGCATQQGV